MDATRAKMVENLQQEVQLLQQQMPRESAAAQRLMQDWENKCNELHKSNNVLQQEADKETLSHHHIFAFAAKQSRHESIAQLEVGIPDKQVHCLTEVLLDCDGELASTEYTVHHIVDQVEELCCVKRRSINLMSFGADGSAAIPTMALWTGSETSSEDVDDSDKDHKEWATNVIADISMEKSMSMLQSPRMLGTNPCVLNIWVHRPVILTEGILVPQAIPKRIGALLF